MTRALTALLLLLTCVGGCGAPAFLIRPVSGRDAIEEVVVDRPARASSDKIAVIPVEGLIANGREAGLLGPGENKVDLLAQQLKAAAADKNVKAVVLRVNSPGGTVTGSDTMHALVQDFRQASKKPVVASVQELGASGGYYVACAADRIVAGRTSLVGSIGVIFTTFEASPLLARLGVTTTTIKSGPLKDAGSPFRAASEDDKRVFQAMVDENYQGFLRVVRAARPNVTDFATATDGRVMTGTQAHALGLVDELGTLEDAVRLARAQANTPRAKAVMYRRPYGPSGSVYASFAPDPPKASVELGVPQALQPGFYYLWRP